MPYFDNEGEPYSVLCYADIHRAHMSTLNDERGLTLLNTGSVGNSIGDTYAHYAILTGEIGRTSAPFAVEFVSLEYNRAQAIRDALADPNLPNQQAYIRELETGIYSR